MSGRSRSLATRLFFEAQFLSLDEVPHRTIIDLKATLGELSDQPPYGEFFPSGPPKNPEGGLPGAPLGFGAPHLPGPNPASLPEQPNPSDHRADADAKLRSRLAS